ncbi:aspartic peptidase domain-containing protein [Fomes fomentarius]|nr:aspartic peptidase domain-containing protein [Fomes fomentarius]
MHAVFLALVVHWVPVPFLAIAASVPRDPSPRVLTAANGRTHTVPFRLASASVSLPKHRIYLVNVTVAGSVFEVVLDTGSSDLWIDTGNSSSSAGSFGAGIVQTDVAVLLQYGVDSAHTYARGTVQYANSFVNVPGTTNITQYGCHGILGLGPREEWSTIRYTLRGTNWTSPSFTTTLFDENPGMEQSFTVAFGPRDATGEVSRGTVTFGAAPASFAGLLASTQIPLLTGQFWDTPSEGFVVDEKIVNFSGSIPLRFILDSGTYGAFAPPEYVKAIYGSVPGGFLLDDGTWSVPCDTKFNVSVLLGPTEILVHPIDMAEVYKIEEGKPLCKGLFVGNTDARLPFLIGLNVMRNMQILHHYGQSGNPYLQIVSTTDMETAFAEFDAMNTARISAFQGSNRVGSSTVASSTPASSSSPPIESVIANFLQTSKLKANGMENLTMRRWPWSEDATSTAPQIGRKRRLSTSEPDERESTPAKRHRAESEVTQDGQREESPTGAQQAKETEEVKEVTKGVGEVELDDEGKPKEIEIPTEVAQTQTTETTTAADAEEAAAVPLPDSPKAVEEGKEDVDAEGEEDVEAKEGEDAADATDATVVDDVSSSGKEESPSVATVTDEEVPGLVLASDSPKKPVKAKTSKEKTAVAS